MYRASGYLKLFSTVCALTFILLSGYHHCAYEKENKNVDFFSEAHELLDQGEYAKSFAFLRTCVHYDIRCLTLSGVFYYLGLEPVERDVINALYIWKVCADYGSADAQFYLGIMYSNYFSLPNLYSYYVEESKIEDTFVLWRVYLRLEGVYLRRSVIYCLRGEGAKCQVREKDEEENAKDTSEDGQIFRTPPVVTLTKNNKLTVKVKNIRYNTDELKWYFDNIENFPNRDYLEKNEKKVNFTRNHSLSLLYLYSSSLAKHPGSTLSLGIRYMNGYGVEKNCETASRYFLKLTSEIINADNRTHFEMTDLIKLSIPHYDQYNMNNRKIKNIELFLETSLHDNHRILTMIARRYLIGIDGVERNYKKALAYLTRAAKYDNSEAISLLGYIHLLGLGVKIDYSKATDYFIRGNKLNDPLSYNGLGYIHFFGLGSFKKNTHLAFYYFDLAAKSNLSSAQFNLACLYLSGVGIAQSFHNAFYWFYKALNNGNVLAAYTVGFMHYNGIIINRNCKVALSLMAKVAENNSFILSTSNKIIRYTEKGRIKEALFLMAQLAETGNVQAQIGISQNINNSKFALFLPANDKAKKVYASRYLAMASENNDFKSLFTLGDYAYQGHGLYVRIFPKNGLPFDELYDVNRDEYLFRFDAAKQTKKDEQFDEVKKDKQFVMATRAMTDEISSLDTPPNEIYSADFVDEQGLIFNDRWRFNYGLKFSFNEVDYNLAYHHYKSIISHYPNNFYVIQTISKACYNLGFMHYYGIGVAKNIQKALAYFNSSIKIYPTHKAPSVLFVLYIMFNKHLYNFKKKFKHLKWFLPL
ncbi:ubiquitin-protein ligase, putative [Plasmodium knowlesi strain H]|uniref:Ubiquitin-protein ligase, putative n=3 Tax=Plasmodium knowlesi TaxID=5850 RepID=A0A5K1U0Y5_PLAKH|nr:ubiquitin-protein ligase, putative [Plasmodium knowlesi strain H]OTN65646.1 putative SEL-1 protein [Plasmodium knowlesi]CAA9989665.1 ubiquitin-protein ligase, putative [Plasmodium knowlesi strain H]SBO22788.1 ubiquitin-protein ligase, putative [Plasmodium knowlesi strain H]SBO23114.1 ubiquitin-protein ligase, putative [Plasmodium knowlesi strain H]VVS79139.1 ubiquitin-protein ligase, putative [Plasmodium knowlesi strain H]|eukprot:XP_002260389.1 SEL-1 protein, putative [Plasmodium knowlesi strain H]